MIFNHGTEIRGSWRILSGYNIIFETEQILGNRAIMEGYNEGTMLLV